MGDPMKFLRWLNPVPGIKDFVHEVRRESPHRWRIALLAAAVTFSIFSVMWQEEMVGPPAKPDIIWISTFAPDRTDEEIIASNLANQKEKERLTAEQAERDRKVQEIYRTLGTMSGMDVEKIEREAEAERAAATKAEAEKMAALRGRAVDAE